MSALPTLIHLLAGSIIEVIATIHSVHITKRKNDRRRDARFVEDTNRKVYTYVPKPPGYAICIKKPFILALINPLINLMNNLTYTHINKRRAKICGDASLYL